MNLTDEQKLETTLQIEQAEQWIRKQFISEIDIDELPLDWSYAWVLALSRLANQYSALVRTRIQTAPTSEVLRLLEALKGGEL
ncbi:MAG: hypothetical protein HC908_01640 [Calothrix sp. SM1_7_51]|nr:hypothetical protein [Calothrix sp. SM1_7_51]